jgi:hypothetical protein
VEGAVYCLAGYTLVGVLLLNLNRLVMMLVLVSMYSLTTLNSLKLLLCRFRRSSQKSMYPYFSCMVRPAVSVFPRYHC